MTIRKKTIFVSIFGPPNSGKTTIIQLLKRLLESSKVETQISWNTSEPPTKDPPDYKLKSVADKIKVVITETQEKRIPVHRHESPDDYQVRVYYISGVGYGVSVTMQGVTLKHDFGEKFPVLKERARSIAARLANELGVNVIDEISNEPDYVQPGDYSPDLDL